MSRVFDFDSVPDRRGTGCVKWDVKANELPMWVADMDFEVAPEIAEAIKTRAAHPVFGYTDINTEWRDAYVGWWRDRHSLEIEGRDLVFVTGVVPAISSAVRRFTSPGENVVIMTPVYNIFYNSILNNGRNVVERPLLRGENGYSVDWEGFERDLRDSQTTLFILCNPHNPVGKIWDRETLARIGELCKTNGVTVVSDEIHCDVVTPGKEYVPFASVSKTCREISVTCIAPTKAFNIAGIQTAAVFSHNGFLRHKIWRQINTDECGEPSVFAVPAAVAAFRYGKDWLDAMNAYVYENKKFVRDFLANNAPGIRYDLADATYLAWLDVSRYTTDSAKFCDALRRETGLFVSNGKQYGKTGETFIRVNLATSRANVKDGMERLCAFVNK